MAQDTSDTFELAGKTLADKYAVEKVIAKGGFGTVYYARHTELQTAVAVKVLMVPDRFQGSLRAAFLEKFKLEARTIATLNHASIVRVIDYGSATFASGESPWMALEWIEGRTLEDELDNRDPRTGRSPRETLDLMRPAFDALACAHDVGVAHRDIKPANMMVVKARRGEPGLRMLDFGIAKVMEADEQAGSGLTATKTELSAFSLMYAAPEQISQARTGPWTDVHALALVLTEVITDSKAYRGDDTTQLFAEIVGRDRPTPGHYGVNVGPWEEVFKRALSLRPSERYPNAGDFLSALESTVLEAERAWQTNRSLPSVPVSTQVMAASSPMTPALRPDTLVGASTSSSQPPSVVRSPRWVPVAVVASLSVLALGVYVATRSPAPSAQPAHAAAVRPVEHPTVTPVAPLPEATPTVPVEAPVAPAMHAAADPIVTPEAPDASAPVGRAGRRGRRERASAQVGAAIERTAPATAPARAPGIVIE